MIAGIKTDQLKLQHHVHPRAGFWSVQGEVIHMSAELLKEFEEWFHAVRPQLTQAHELESSDPSMAQFLRAAAYPSFSPVFATEPDENGVVYLEMPLNPAALKAHAA